MGMMCFSRHKLTCRVTAFISLLLGRLPEDRYKAQYSGEVLGPPGPGLGRDLVWDRDRPKLQEIDFRCSGLLLLHGRRVYSRGQVWGRDWF